MRNLSRILILVGIIGVVSAPAFADGKPNETPTCTAAPDVKDKAGDNDAGKGKVVIPAGTTDPAN